MGKKVISCSSVFDQNEIIQSLIYLKTDDLSGDKYILCGDFNFKSGN
jgi:hypothetical protein